MPDGLEPWLPRSPRNSPAAPRRDSQGQVVGYRAAPLELGHPAFHPHFVHTVKGFGIVNKAEIDVFLELSCFFDDPVDIGNLISESLPFLNPA